MSAGRASVSDSTAFSCSQSICSVDLCGPSSQAGSRLCVVTLLYSAPFVIGLIPGISAQVRIPSFALLAIAPLLSVLFFGRLGLGSATVLNLIGFLVLFQGWLSVPASLRLLSLALIAATQVGAFIVSALMGRLKRNLIELESANGHLSDLAHIDCLTSVFNHRFFMERLQSEVDQACLSGKACALLLIDVDYFKHYNDVYGHLAGDEALRRLALILRRSVRETDTVARYGGEEFAVITPELCIEDAKALADRLRGAVARHRFSGDSNQPGGALTVSVGLSVFPAWAKDMDSLLDQADEALYHAKHKSGDRVEAYSNIMDELAAPGDHEVALLAGFRTLLSIISTRDQYTYGHSERVMRYAVAIAQQLGLPEHDLRTIRWSALAHDLGKLDVPKSVLMKRGPLDSQEWSLIRQHPERSASILKPVSEELGPVVEVVRAHHERYDGTGYPTGSKGEAIPMAARILAVADAIDAMRSQRPYRDPRGTDEILRELVNCSGTQFDPNVVNAALQVFDTALA